MDLKNKLINFTLQKNKMTPNKKIIKLIVISLVSFLFIFSLLEPKKVFVGSLVIVGKFVYPEASAVLQHYCFGNGDTLWINDNYIRNSKVFKKYSKNLKLGETKKVWFKQSEDWRLSYALNPFYITKKKDGYIIYQYIVFDTKGDVYTDLNLFLFKIRIYDSIVHTFNCTPYVVMCKINP